jgi:hypothetical protein
MSIGADEIGALPLSAQALATSPTAKPPKKRTVTAQADVVEQPEAR